MLGRAARVPRRMSQLPGPGNKKALQCNGFLTENLRCTGPATDEKGCSAGLPGDHKRHPVCRAGQTGRVTRLVCRGLKR